MTHYFSTEDLERLMMNQIQYQKDLDEEFKVPLLDIGSTLERHLRSIEIPSDRVKILVMNTSVEKFTINNTEVIIHAKPIPTLESKDLEFFPEQKRYIEENIQDVFDTLTEFDFLVFGLFIPYVLNGTMTWNTDINEQPNALKTSAFLGGYMVLTTKTSPYSLDAYSKEWRKMLDNS